MTRAVLLAFALLVACKREDPSIADDDPPKKTSKAKSSKSEPEVDQSRVLRSKSGRLRVVFPPSVQVPDEKTQTIPSAVGPLVMHIWDAQRADEELTVMWSDYPDGHAKALGPKSVLAGVQSGALKGMNATLDRDEGGELEGRPYRLFTFDAPPSGAWKQGYGRELAILDGDRLYQVLYLGPDKEAVSSARIESFFSSFHIVE